MVFPETNILLNIPVAEDTHEEMLKIVSFDDRVSYHRFNVEIGLEGIGIRRMEKQYGAGSGGSRVFAESMNTPRISQSERITKRRLSLKRCSDWKIKQSYVVIRTYKFNNFQRPHRLPSVDASPHCLDVFPIFGIPTRLLPVDNAGYTSILHQDISGIEITMGE
jgi:hypothetical protein